MSQAKKQSAEQKQDWD
jgi:hypothetical protein